MSRIIKCDRCGGEVDPKRIGYVSMLQRNEKTGELEGENPFENMDICGNCMDLIAAFITNDTAVRQVTKPARGGRSAKQKPP